MKKDDNYYWEYNYFHLIQLIPDSLWLSLCINWFCGFHPASTAKLMVSHQISYPYTKQSFSLMKIKNKLEKKSWPLGIIITHNMSSILGPSEA